MNFHVLLNAAAGVWDSAAADTLAERIASSFAAQGASANVEIVPPEKLREAAERAAHGACDALVVAGGDGSVNTVASVLVGTRKPMGILPLGTLNHFAKDLAIPATLEAAIHAVCTIAPRAVDLGSVNGRLFINNSSIGFYPLAVRDRDRQRSKLGRNKWVALFLASLRIFRRFPLLSVHLIAEEAHVARKTPLVFVGNNQYELDLLTLGVRKCLSSGTLTLYTANCTTRWGLVRLLVRALFGRLKQARDFDILCGPQFTVHSRKRRLSVALDGETTHLIPPLEYKSLPGALLVIAPPDSAGAEPDLPSK